MRGSWLFFVGDQSHLISSAALVKLNYLTHNPVSRVEISDKYDNKDNKFVCLSSGSHDDIVNSILSRSTLNVNAPCFEMRSSSRSTLNVHAKPFVPR